MYRFFCHNCLPYLQFAHVHTNFYIRIWHEHLETNIQQLMHIRYTSAGNTYDGMTLIDIPVLATYATNQWSETPD